MLSVQQQWEMFQRSCGIWGALVCAVVPPTSQWRRGARYAAREQEPEEEPEELKKLEEEHAYLKKKVAHLTKDRLKDRSSESKDILTRLKRTKLMIKDAIARAKATLTK